MFNSLLTKSEGVVETTSSPYSSRRGGGDVGTTNIESRASQLQAVNQPITGCEPANTKQLGEYWLYFLQ
jgi:hypothetical protein